MTTVIRVRRRRTCDPIISLVLGPQRKKRCHGEYEQELNLEKSSEKLLPRVFCYLGSISTADDDSQSGELSSVLSKAGGEESLEFAQATGEPRPDDVIERWSASLEKQKAVQKYTVAVSTNDNDRKRVSFNETVAYQSDSPKPRPNHRHKFLQLPDGRGAVSFIDLERSEIVASTPVNVGEQFREASGIVGTTTEEVDDKNFEAFSDNEGDDELDLYGVDSEATNRLHMGRYCWQVDEALANPYQATDDHISGTVALVEIQDDEFRSHFGLEHYMEEYGDVDDTDSDSENGSVDYPSEDDFGDGGHEDDWLFGYGNNDNAIKGNHIIKHDSNQFLSEYRPHNPRIRYPDGDSDHSSDSNSNDTTSNDSCDNVNNHNCSSRGSIDDDYGFGNTGGGISSGKPVSDRGILYAGDDDIMISNELEKRWKSQIAKDCRNNEKDIVSERIDLLAQMEAEWEAKKDVPYMRKLKSTKSVRFAVGGVTELGIECVKDMVI